MAGTNRIVLHESADQQHIGSSGSGARDCGTEVTGSTLERSDVNILVSGRIGHAAADQLLSHTTEGRPNMWFFLFGTERQRFGFGSVSDESGEDSGQYNQHRVVGIPQVGRNGGCNVTSRARVRVASKRCGPHPCRNGANRIRCTGGAGGGRTHLVPPESEVHASGLSGYWDDLHRIRRGSSLYRTGCSPREQSGMGSNQRKLTRSKGGTTAAWTSSGTLARTTPATAGDPAIVSPAAHKSQTN